MIVALIAQCTPHNNNTITLAYNAHHTTITVLAYNVKHKLHYPKVYKPS